MLPLHVEACAARAVPLLGCCRPVAACLPSALAWLGRRRHQSRLRPSPASPPPPAGVALRVPTPTVSVVDLVVQVEKKTFAEEVNEAFREAANGPMKGVLAVRCVPERQAAAAGLGWAGAPG